jgi:Zn-dependent protease
LGLAELLEPTRLIALAMLSLTSMPVHEWAHAWVAYELGDDTAARRGRLTLNPLAHIDPIGSLMLVLAGFGWGKPVPVNPLRLRGDLRVSRALVSVAGPFSNFVLAMLAAIPFRMSWLGTGRTSLSFAVEDTLLSFIWINLVLAVFNMLPIPPLDGSRVLAAVLPRSWAQRLERIEGLGGGFLMILLLLLMTSGMLSRIVNPVVLFLARALL